MTEPLTPRFAQRDPGAAARRPIVVAALLVVLLGALSVIVTAWAPPTGASPSQEPTSAPQATESNGGSPASTAPPLVEQRPLPGDTTPTAPVQKGDALNNALPRPNSGHKPYYQGDRGTGSQYAVLGAMILALVVIASLVYRQSRRSHTRWTAASPMASMPDQPSSADRTPPNETRSNEPPASEAP